MGALMACRSCGFVTRRGGEIGARGHCPHCERAMEPVTLTAARKIAIRKQELARAAPVAPELARTARVAPPPLRAAPPAGRPLAP